MLSRGSAQRKAVFTVRCELLGLSSMQAEPLVCFGLILHSLSFLFFQGMDSKATPFALLPHEVIISLAGIDERVETVRSDEDIIGTMSKKTLKCVLMDYQ